MLKIQVLGNGMIPRGLGLAPRKEPFFADLTLIGTILATRGLKVNYINPETGQPKELNNKNLMQVWNKYQNVPIKPIKPAEDPQTAPHVPENKDPGEQVPPVQTPSEDPLTAPVIPPVPPVDPEPLKVENTKEEEERKVEETAETSDKNEEESSEPEQNPEQGNEDNKEEETEENKEENAQQQPKTYPPYQNPNKNKNKHK